MKLTFVGAAHEVTGSCHFLQAAGKNILIDCGMEQGPDLYENPGLPIPENEIDYVFLTHAHIDHSGMLPKLAKNGFKGQIFTTFATADLCNIMLRDSAHIQEFEAEWPTMSNKTNDEGCVVLESGRIWEDKHYLYPLPTDQLNLFVNQNLLLKMYYHLLE